ncbi:hypothetical protein COP2_019068 [Malus domestica]
MSSDRDLEDVHSPHGDALVIKVQILNALDDCILVDNGFRVSVLFKDAAKKIGILDNINKGRTTLHNFNGATVQSFGTIKLVVQAGPYKHLVTFYMMDCLTSYNAILG